MMYEIFFLFKPQAELKAQVAVSSKTKLKTCGGTLQKWFSVSGSIILTENSILYLISVCLIFSLIRVSYVLYFKFQSISSELFEISYILSKYNFRGSFQKFNCIRFKLTEIGEERSW